MLKYNKKLPYLLPKKYFKKQLEKLLLLRKCFHFSKSKVPFYMFTEISLKNFAISLLLKCPKETLRKYSSPVVTNYIESMFLKRPIKTFHDYRKH
jgi:hypothetical protein